MAVYQGTLATITRQVWRKMRLDIDQDEDDIHVWINLAYLDVVQRTECLQKTSSAAMTENVDSYVIPDGVLIIKRLDILYADNTVSNPMQEVTLENILAIRQTDSQVPQMALNPVYALMGQDQIEVWPVPMAGQSLRFWYVYAPQQLTLDADEPLLTEPFGSKLLEVGACMEAARFKKDPLLQEFETLYEYWISRYISFQNRSNIIHQFPINESGNQIPSNPSADYAFNWR